MNAKASHKANKNITNYKVMLLFFIGCFVLIAANFPEHVDNVDKVDVIMIDAGHGGDDPGNLGTKRYKTTEKDVTLKVAMKLGKYIEERIPEVRVLYTRKSDTYPTLKERTQMANKHKVDLFISVHCDAFHKESAKGCGTYVMGTAKTEANLRMAQRENASILKEKNYKTDYAGFDPYSPESYIELSLRQNTFIEHSISFSDKVQDQFRDRVGRVDRGVKQAPFWVICYTTMPSVLIELGFLTNKREEDFLQSERGQDLMASAIFRAFRSYKEDREGIKIKPIIQEAEVRDVTSDLKEEIKTEQDNSKSKEKIRGIVFKVQLMTTSESLETIPENFNGLTEVDEYISNGLFKYTFGAEKKYEKAQRLQKKVADLGFHGAFIIAFENGERISLEQALTRSVGD